MSVRKTTTKAAAEAVAAKTTPAKTEETKTETVAKKTTVKRGSAKKEAAAKKATATKPTAKAVVKETVFLQFAGKEYDMEVIKTNVKTAWAAETGKKESDIKDVQIYVKPEESAAYYVVNGEFVEGGRKIDL